MLVYSTLDRLQTLRISIFLVFLRLRGYFQKIETTFKSRETCCTASHVLTNLNIGGPNKIVYSLFRTNYKILLPTAG